MNAISAGEGATKYGYSSSASSQPTSWQDSTSFTTGLTADTTYYFFAKYEGDTNYNEAVSNGTEIKTESAIVWSPLSATITTTAGEEIVNYYPVLGGTNPQPDKFAYSTDGVTFTEIEKPDGGYTMTGDVATYAKAGQLYYSGGSLNTVRSINSISYDNVWTTNDVSFYPYYASCDYSKLCSGGNEIKAKIANDGSETVEKVAMEMNGEPSEAPTINGVSITDIYNAYRNGSSGFGGAYGSFWSCVITGSYNAFYYAVSVGDFEFVDRAFSDNYCVLISRIFN